MVEEEKFDFVESIQQGILYLIKSDSHFFNEIIALIKPEYFETELHENIFRVVETYYTKYKTLPTDDIILEEIKCLKKLCSYSEYREELKDIGTAATLAYDNREYYLDLVEKFAKEQGVKYGLLKCIEHLRTGNIGMIEEVMRSALSINRNVNLGIDYYGDFDKRWDKAYNVAHKKKYITGFTKLDENLDGGLNVKELAMVASPAGTGKSLFLVQQGVVALSKGMNVLYISLEMSEELISARFDANITSVKVNELKQSKNVVLSKLNSIWKSLEKKYGKKPQLKIKEFPTGSLTANGVRALLSQLQNTDGFIPEVIILDYLELMRPTTPGMAEYIAQERVAQELRGIAQEKECLVWTATQTNRDGKRVPVITDLELADSYGKIRTCDFALSLNQTSQEYDESKARLYVIKSRNSKTKFTVPIKMNYNYLRLRDS